MNSQFLYKHLSPGYLGIQKQRLTLNSTFYGILLHHLNLDNELIIFPQRVLKKDFFDELTCLEGEKFHTFFKIIQNKIEQNFDSTFLNLKKDKKYFIKFTNLLNLMLRLGLASKITSINYNELTKKLTQNEFLEIQLLNEIAKLRNDPTNIQLESLKNIGKLVLTQSNLQERIQILILNFLIVAVYRYGINLTYENHTKKYYEKLIFILENQKEKNVGAQIRNSVAYRGIAMINELGFELKDFYIKKAEQVARNIQTDDAIFKILTQENLFTCLQSVAKWNMHLKKFDEAKKNLLEMISLDPLDSTGHAELGFLFLAQEKFHKAATAFKRAAKLGPPAVGMHTYYYASCLYETGKYNQYISKLKESHTLDKHAVSPLLELFEYYINANEHYEAKKIANLLLDCESYISQLEHEEIQMLNDILKS